MPNKKRSQKSKKTSFKASNFTSSTTGKYFLVFGILLAVSVPMMFWQFDTNPITGFVSYKAYKQTVNLDLPESTMYILSTRNPEQLNITSFAVYGDVIGEGRVEIYLQSNEKKLLMYSNVREVDKGLAALTGMVIGDDGSTSDTDPNAEEGNMLVLKEQKEQYVKDSLHRSGEVSFSFVVNRAIKQLEDREGKEQFWKPKSERATGKKKMIIKLLS